MKKILFVVLCIPTLLNAAELNSGHLPIKVVPVIAINNGGTNVGTDAGTTTHPKGGLDTMPTKNVGSEYNKVNPHAPSTKPFMAPAFSPPPAFATDPAHTPPASQGGTTNTPAHSY
ncbi:MAG: hypothetical protein H0U57_12690 [Tatlockia sp.]|nr:hypothetical protein [Tatlockia sp.]